MKLTIRDEADTDALEAALYYYDIRPKLGVQFRERLKAVYESIAFNPWQFPKVMAICGMKASAPASTSEVLAGSVERVTFHNPDAGFCVLRVKARGHRELVTVVGHAGACEAAVMCHGMSAKPDIPWHVSYHRT